MSASKLPSEDQVQSLLTSLFGEEVAVRPVEAPKLKEASSVTATYANDEGSVSKLLVCDLPFAYRVGAALTRIPSGTVDEAIATAEMPENIRENLHEVLNICVNLFPALNGSHVVLDEVAIMGDENGISVDSSEPEERISFEVDIPRYGQGVVSLSHLSVDVAKATA